MSFVAIALVLQSLVLVMGAQAQASSDDMISGGVGSKEQILAHYDANTNNFRDVMTYNGITRAELASMSVMKRFTVDSSSYSWGWTPRFSEAQGQRAHSVAGRTVYSRPHSLWDFSWYNGWEGKSAARGTFRIVSACGNLVTYSVPTPPAPKPTPKPEPKPQPAVTCDSLTVTPIQGSAADIIKLAMIKTHRALQEGGFKSRILLQVHDELVLEIMQNEKEQVAELVRDAMENVVQLSVPLSVESQQVIGASLGQKAKRMGIIAVLVGLGAIMFFMLVYYKGAGVNACVAQILNLYIVFSVLSAFNMTITLSSIAGMILTIGMAVDANVIIFERIKEELSDGKGRTAAIAAGFRNAFWAIMDSNITTFIAAMFLSQLGSGAIQGFAVSLAIGVVSSVFTALFVSHLMFDFNTDVFRKNTVSISWRVK